MPRYLILLLALLGAASGPSFGQVTINIGQGSILGISPNTYVATHNLGLQGNGQLALASSGLSSFSLTGDLSLPNGTSTSFTNSSTSLAMVGSGMQTITGTGFTLPNLTLNKPSGGVNYNTSGATSIGGLTLTQGNLVLQGGDVTLATSPNGGSSNSYMVTCVGGVNISTSGSTYTIPLGTAGSAYSGYTPVTLATAGVSQFHMWVSDAEPSPATGADAIVQKTWTIQQLTGSTPVDITFTWPTLAQGALFDPLQPAQVFHYNGTSWDATLPTPTVPTSFTGGYSLTCTGLTGFGSFAVGNNNSPLPIVLLSFTGQRQGNSVQLNWETVTELNNDYFEIQRSTESRFGGYSVVDKVPGHGTTTQPTSYTYLDASTPASTLYYRLRQVDYDGKFSYSPIVEILPLNGSTCFALVPNPYQPSFSLQLVPLMPGFDLSSLGELQVVSQLGNILYNAQGKFSDLALAASQAIVRSGKGVFFTSLTFNGITCRLKLIAE